LCRVNIVRHPHLSAGDDAKAIGVVLFGSQRGRCARRMWCLWAANKDVI
jgi:hypothetical protein